MKCICLITIIHFINSSFEVRTEFSFILVQKTKFVANNVISFLFSHAIANKIKIEINVFSDTRYILYLAIKDFLFFTKMQDMSGWIKHVTLYVKNFSFYFDIKTVAELLSKAVNRMLVCISYELLCIYLL